MIEQLPEELDDKLRRLAWQRNAVETERDMITDELKAAARDARSRGYSAQRIANTVGVAKRTIQLWTD